MKWRAGVSSGVPGDSDSVEPEKAEPGVAIPEECHIWPDWRQMPRNTTAMNYEALPKPQVGMIQAVGAAENDGCVAAADRLGPFGHSSHNVGDTAIDQWDSVHWGHLQTSCASKNYDHDPLIHLRQLKRTSEHLDDELSSAALDRVQTGRTAVVLRTWNEYEYSQNQLAWMRTIITELSLDTRGRYQVFLLVDVKDSSLDLFDAAVYAETLAKSIPAEFRDLALLYSSTLLQEWYPKTDEHGAQDQMYQAVQIFSYTFPEFDNVWQLEMDFRFTGNVASMLTGASEWAKAQPRKNLWERNAQFFTPGLWDSYADFAARVDVDMNDEGVWGPDPNAELFLRPQGPTPPSRSDTRWGIGEEAELLDLAPIIDTSGSEWTYEDTVHGFEPAANLSRRMAMVSVTRTSRRLLRLISSDQRKTGNWVVSESTPETWSLLHGFKAVYVPHLVSWNFKDEGQFGPGGSGSSTLSPQELNDMIHRGPKHNRAGGNKASFLYLKEGGLSEYRWLDASYFYWNGDGQRVWWQYTNGTCLPPMILHPVKND